MATGSRSSAWHRLPLPERHFSFPMPTTPHAGLASPCRRTPTTNPGCRRRWWGWLASGAWRASCPARVTSRRSSSTPSTATTPSGSGPPWSRACGWMRARETTVSSMSPAGQSLSIRRRRLGLPATTRGSRPTRSSVPVPPAYRRGSRATYSSPASRSTARPTRIGIRSRSIPPSRHRRSGCRVSPRRTGSRSKSAILPI